jgi:membrane protein DedA with SNARE-associated domain
MSLQKFISYTFIGAALWNLALLYAGFKLGEHWDKIHQYSRELDIILVIAVILFFAYFIWKHHHTHKNQRFLVRRKFIKFSSERKNEKNK